MGNNDCNAAAAVATARLVTWLQANSSLHGDAIMLPKIGAGGANQQSLCAFHEPLARFFSVA